MIFTLAWKELREHLGVWLTMAFMTVAMSLFLGWIVALDNPLLGQQVRALTIFGMAATYGVVCGAMMFAGEHEAGTMVYLDIFLGRRGLLWISKFAIGVGLVLAQSAVVPLALRYLEQDPPLWVMALAGQVRGQPNPNAWFVILPAVSLCAYAFGLLGSSMTQRVLSGASVAAVCVTPVWLLGILAPPFGFFAIQAVAALIVLGISWLLFVNQSQETMFAAAPESPEPRNAADRFFEVWDRYEEEDERARRELAPVMPLVVPAGEPVLAAGGTSSAPASVRPRPTDAKSPAEVLWWLTLMQARPLAWPLAIGCVLAGLLVAVNTQVLWPLTTLLLGVICGVAAFAPEQRDLSFQFLSAQHFPHRTVWRFKLGLWLAIALTGALLIAGASYARLSLRGGPNASLLAGSLPGFLGPMIFAAVWLAYGFTAGQIVVWHCRKTILALLLATLVAAGGIGAWLPSLLCGGMAGWQVWAGPLALLLTTWLLMRAWMSGRIRERKPLAAIVGVATLSVLWLLLNFGYRAWNVADAPMLIDPVQYKEDLPGAEENLAAKAIHDAIQRLDEPAHVWLVPLAEVTRQPTGVLELPRSDGGMPYLSHLSGCRTLTEELLALARKKESGPAFEHIAHVLAISRNLRNQAPYESYLAGVKVEEDAFPGLDGWLARGKTDPKLLRRVLDELNRHAKETPPPRSCLEAECYRSYGMLGNPTGWSFLAHGEADRLPERWLAGGIAVSLEMPWEAERSARIWRQVWAGLFRAVDTPHWELPVHEELHTKKQATRMILAPWLPADRTRTDLARALDASWLTEHRLFCDVTTLRSAATRSRWRVDSARQMVALLLYRIELDRHPERLQDLVPRYLTQLPVDPYSGQVYGYGFVGPLLRESVWSTGPDKIDHGGKRWGNNLADHDPQWAHGELDLVIQLPHRP